MTQKPKYDFSQPNKLARKALWLVLGNALWKTLRSMWPILALFVVRRDFSSRSLWIYAFILVIILLNFVRLLINYFYYSYQITGDELIINKGWLSKSTTVVKFDKIHEVNLNQKFIHKIVGLYLVGIDTAGTSKTEIEINGIDFKKALALKEVLTQSTVEHIENTEENNSIESEKSRSEEQIKISVPSLIKIGLTRNYLQTFGLLVAFSFQIIDQIKDILYTNDDEYTFLDQLFSSASYEQLMGLVGVVLLLGIIIFVVLFNLIRTLFTYFNYQINIRDHNFTVSYGLTDSHIISIPSNRVQLFQFQQNYFQKLMNLLEVKIKQIASEHNAKQKKGMIVPGANRAEAHQIFRVIYQQDFALPTQFFRPHKRVLLLKFLWLCIPALLALSFFYFSETMHYAWIILPIFTFVYFLIYCGYRNEKLYIANDLIIIKKGIWDITTTCLQISKIQQISVKQSYFQQKRQLGSLNLHTAAGTVNVYYYDFDLLQKLANEWLHKIEKNRFSWM